LRLPGALLLLAACLLSYANAVPDGFTYDDKAIVRDNPRIRAPDKLDEIFTTQYFGGERGTGTAYRPVLLLSYAVQWWIHGGEAAAFHTVNVLLHGVATLLFVRLLLTLGIAPPAALASALLFAVHPIHVEAVTSIVGRGETQAAVLTLGYLLLGLRFADRRGRRWLSLSLSLLVYGLAVLTKESAAAAPALLLLCLAWRADGPLWPRLRDALRRGFPLYAGSAAILIGVLRVRTWVLGGPLKAPDSGIFELENPLAKLPPLIRAANACVLFFFSLGRLVFPLRLSSDESAWAIRPLGPRNVLFWLAPLLLAALAAAALRGLRYRTPTAFGFLFLALAALPASNLLFPTGTIFAERLAYLPSAGFCLIAGSWILGDSKSGVAPGRARLLLLTAVVVLFAARTVVRNAVWASDETLFTNMVRVSPESAKAHYDFAYMSATEGRKRAALESYTRATQIFPRYWDAWAGRGRMERDLGNVAASETSYAEAVRLAPFYENGYFGLGAAREARGDRAGAEEAYRTGLRHKPNSLPLAFRMAELLTAERRPTAGHAWHRALAIDPGSPATRVGYARWLAAVGRRDEALREAREILRRTPRFAPALEVEARILSGSAPAS
jgi:tetratricopeptide (TPR) repeat protein